MSFNNIVKMGRLQFIHVLDLNTNIPSMYQGPATYVLKDNEQLLRGPESFVIVPPGHFCKVMNPVVKETAADGKFCELHFGRVEVRTSEQSPFPLYVGEALSEDPAPLPVIRANQALHLLALIPFTDTDPVTGENIERQGGDEWQIIGPCTYTPRSEVVMQSVINTMFIGMNEALKVEAKRAFVDMSVEPPQPRVAGECWIVRREGAYIPSVECKVVEVVKTHTLTETTALHLIATSDFVDVFNKKRSAGDEWLVTLSDTETYVPGVHETVHGVVQQTVVQFGEFCVVVDKLCGRRVMRRGLCSFFLLPNERFEGSGTQPAYVLQPDEALLVMTVLAIEPHESEDEDAVDTGVMLGTPDDHKPRKAGERWLVRGPCMYIPRIEVEVKERRTAIPLRLNEGIYVRNVQTGEIRSVMGPTSYMLGEWEEKWQKELPEIVERCLQAGGGYSDSADIRKLAYFRSFADPNAATGKRVKSKVVTYRAPNNTAVQIYNHFDQTSRIVFGPMLVVLGPHDAFNVLRLSAGKPKVKGALYSLALMLGPDYISDVVEVETSDHARLYIRLSFNNKFDYDIEDPASVARLFSVPDFIGFACRKLGSIIRNRVAKTTFEDFHRHSARIIQEAVFPKREARKFENGLVITQVDVQTIEPIDDQMRQSLLNSVQMAIEISTKSMEDAARRDAELREQKAAAGVNLQILINEIEKEKAKLKYVGLLAENIGIDSCGQSTAEAKARAIETLIEAKSFVDSSKFKAEAAELDFSTELDIEEQTLSSERHFKSLRNKNELHMSTSLTEIEIAAFRDQIEAIGSSTIAAIARAGPEMQAMLLGGLGLESVLITDGKSPINLFNTANGLVSGSSKAIQ
jgi:major vault protein